MMSLLLPLALLACAVWIAFRIAASPTYLLLAHLFGGWAERCRHGPELAEASPLGLDTTHHGLVYFSLTDAG